MRALQAAALSLLWILAGLSTACAQTQDSSPPPAQEPPSPPRPPDPPRHDAKGRDERIRRLEAHIRELEAGLERKGESEEQRREWRDRLDETRAQLKELYADRKPQDPGRGKIHERMRQVESEIEELEEALKNKEASPEQREKWMGQLERARAEMGKLRAATRPPPGAGQDPVNKDHLAFRLHEIDELLKKGVGPEDQKELMAEKMKIQDELARRGGKQHGGPPMPFDPEMHKLHVAAQELEQNAHNIAVKLRKTPPEEKKAREELRGLLGEAVMKLFDLREQLRAKEVDMLKKRLEELTQLLEKRKSNRDAIIQKRVKQLSGESDDLDW